MATTKGYILLHRQIMENHLFYTEPLCKTMAWVDLLLLAAHKASSFHVRGVIVQVPRGSLAYSLENLCIRWKWSKGKVKRYLSVLQSAGQIVTQNSNVTTLISILNYEKYQSHGKANGKANGYASDTANGTPGGQHTKNVERMKKKGAGNFLSGNAAPLEIIRTIKPA